MNAPFGPQPERFPARWASDWGEDPFGLWQAFTYLGVRQGLRWIPPGRFRMGSPVGEHDRDEHERPHEVILTRGFWLAETACTQALWQAVMGENPSHFKGDQRPVELVSWDDAQQFIARLNTLIAGLDVDRPAASRSVGLKADLRFRLPTEAEWEYACRAGTTTPFSFGEDIDPGRANYDGNHPYRGNEPGLYRQQTVEVATLPANPWGLYEMHGNVWEWCQDWYGDYPTDPVADPLGPATGEWRVLRGGSWVDYGRGLRCAYRGRDHPGTRNGNLGLRLVLGPQPRPEKPGGS